MHYHQIRSQFLFHLHWHTSFTSSKHRPTICSNGNQFFSDLNFYKPTLDQYSLQHHIVDVFSSNTISDFLQVQQNRYLLPILQNLPMDAKFVV